jgi:hypothetical protein
MQKEKEGPVAYFVQKSCHTLLRDWVTPDMMARLLQESHLLLWRDQIDVALLLPPWRIIMPYALARYLCKSHQLDWRDSKGSDLKKKLAGFISWKMIKKGLNRGENST